MTLLDRSASESFRERSLPVLATERLILRAPCFEDAKTIATLANDRRIAENTLRIPHPYGLADAQSFITTANTTGGEMVFLIARRGGAVIGACGIAQFGEGLPEIGYWPFHSGARAMPPKPCARCSITSLMTSVTTRWRAARG